MMLAISWDGSKTVRQSGIHYDTVEVLRLVYDGGVPSEIVFWKRFSIENWPSGSNRNVVPPSGEAIPL